MNKLLVPVLMVCQYVCNVAAIGLFIYFLRQSNSNLASVDVWLIPLILIGVGVGAVFKLARKGASVSTSSQSR